MAMKDDDEKAEEDTSRYPTNSAGGGGGGEQCSLSQQQRQTIRSALALAGIGIDAAGLLQNNGNGSSALGGCEFNITIADVLSLDGGV